VVRYGRKRYDRYLNSTTWAAKRKLVLERDGRRCQKCQSTGPLHVHHLTYDRIGHELLEDLQTLCKTCHAALHRERQRVRNEQRVAANGLRAAAKQKRQQRKQAKSRPPIPRVPQQRKKRLKRSGLAQENERLHAIQAENREHRVATRKRLADLATWR